MKVLLLCYRGNPYCGGQGIYLYYLSSELAKLGAEVDVIVGPPYPDPLDDWATVYKMDNLNVWFLKTREIPYAKLKRMFRNLNFVDYLLTRFNIFPEMETFSIRAFFFLRNLLGKKQYDIIHDINGLGWGLIPARYFGIPIVSTIHHPLTRDREADLMMDRSFWGMVTTLLFYPIAMQRVVIRFMDRVITSSREGVEELNRALGARKEKITYVYNGIDVHMFTNTGEEREERSLLFVGDTEDYKKGLIYLLEALRMLPEDVTLTIVDEGPPRKLTATKMVKKLGLENRVIFTGKVGIRELVSLYSRKTVLVMSSLYEGFGLPAAEAMACETPVVVTSAGALKEVVDHNSGIIVEPKDSKALYAAIQTLLDDNGLRITMGKNGRKRAENNYAWPVAARKTMDVYRSVIRETGGGI